MVGAYEQAKVWCLVDKRVSDGAWGRFFDLVEVVEVEGESLGSKVMGEAGFDANANGDAPHQNIGVCKSMQSPIKAYAGLALLLFSGQRR